MPTVAAADGLPARDAGAWTKEKLYYVKRYVTAFMVAMAPKRRQGKWAQLNYIDLLCGPGCCRIRDSGEEIDGSPLLALGVTPLFDHFHFSDMSRRNVETLRKRIPADCLSTVSLRIGDCNEVVQKVVRDLAARTLAVAFLDPEGFEVHFATLRALARYPVDIVYLFPERHRRQAESKPVHQQRRRGNGSLLGRARVAAAPDGPARSWQDTVGQRYHEHRCNLGRGLPAEGAPRTPSPL